MLGIEQRLAKLGKFDWLRFRDEITGLPDWETIESEQEQHIFSQISAHLNYATDKSLEGPDEPIVFFTFQAGKERSVTRMIYN